LRLRSKQPMAVRAFVGVLCDFASFGKRYSSGDTSRAIKRGLG
jgi:hypothetical protein